jgi:hypothetical protein
MVITAVLPIGGGKFSQYIVLDESVCSWNIISMIKKVLGEKPVPLQLPPQIPIWILVAPYLFLSGKKPQNDQVICG